MKKILIVGPDINKAKGGMAQVIKAVTEDAGLQEKYCMDVFPSYRDGSLPFVTAYGICRLSTVIYTIPSYDRDYIHMTKKGSAKRKGIYVRIAKLFRKKVIVQIHRCENFTDLYLEADRKEQEFIKKTLQSADLVLCLSETWMKTLKKTVGLKNCRYLPNGLDISGFEYSEDGDYVLFLGRLIQSKGINELLDAKKILEDKGVQFPLKIAGPIEDAAPYMEKAKKLDLHDVSFEGWVSGDKKKELLRDAAVMVLPSYAEGFPISVLEGIASGCAIVATDIASVHDMIDEEIVPARDAKALADALERMWTDPEKRHRSAKKNLETLKERFTAEKVHERLGEYYEEVLKG